MPFDADAYCRHATLYALPLSRFALICCHTPPLYAAHDFCRRYAFDATLRHAMPYADAAIRHYACLYDVAAMSLYHTCSLLRYAIQLLSPRETHTLTPVLRLDYFYDAADAATYRRCC